MLRNIGAPEIIVLVLVLVVVFGWKRLPDAARSLGRSARVFKSEVDEMKRESQASSTTVPGETVTRDDDEGAVRENRPRTDNGPRA